LFINFLYKYKSQADFNYNNSNLYTTIKVVSVYTETLLDSLDIAMDSQKVEAQFLKSFNTPVKVVIELKNSKGTVLSTLERIYIPIVKQSATYIKTSQGIERVLAYYVKDNTIYNEVATGASTSVARFNLRRAKPIEQDKETLALKINFNNASIKTPTMKEPEVYLIGRNMLKVKNPNTTTFEKNKITSYINDVLVADSIEESLNFNLQRLELDNTVESINTRIELEGTSSNLSKTKTLIQTLIFKFECSDKLLCSNYLACSN
jgi:hypothetical protein